MTNSEKINRHIHELKRCHPAEVSKACMAILELMLELDKTEQKELSETIYIWSEQHAKHKAPAFYYGKLILAFSYFFSEHYDEALPLLIETQNLFIEHNDADGATLCVLLQGSIHRTHGNFDLALKDLWATHEQLKKDVKFQFFLMACSVNIGGIYLDMEQYDQAIPLFKSTLELSEPRQTYYWTIYSLQGLGKVYLMQKKYFEAKGCLEKAMVISEQYKHPLSVTSSLTELGNYYFTTGDYAEAEQFNKRALVLREEKQFIGGAITNCIHLAEIYNRQFKSNDAVAILEKGLKLAEQVNLKPKMYQIHLLLSEIYERENEMAKSLFHHKRYHELRQQVEQEDNERKIKNAHLVFEAEQTLKENAIIKKQKEEIERKNVQLQHTIDELTRARIGRKAKAITLVIAIALFILQDGILHFALSITPNNYFISLVVKMVIIFSLSPINKAVESYLFKKMIREKKEAALMANGEVLLSR